MNDREILKLYEDGDAERAFSEIVASYSERLYWHIRRFTCSHDDTDDLLQDVFIKVWNSLPSFRNEAGLYTWIYRIATNEALNFLRKNRFKAILKAGTLEEMLNHKIDEDAYFDGNKIQLEVQKAINTLPDKQKQVFILRYFDEMPYEQMSEVLGTSTGALKASYHHAYNKVRTYLEKRF